MKKIIIILLGPLILGPAGYFLGQMMAPEPAPVAEMTEEEMMKVTPKPPLVWDIVLFGVSPNCHMAFEIFVLV